MKLAIVIGASSGIGQSAAIEIAKRGAGVILTYNANAKGAHETVAAIETAGGTAVALPRDMGRSETFPGFVDQVTSEINDRWQRTTVDYLVNHAGFGQMAMFQDTTEELVDRFYRVILKGPYFLTQKLLAILADGGAIINTTSNSSLRPEAGYSAYASMKGALTTLTKCMAKEFGDRGIRVNGVAPGPTRTRIADDAFDRYPDVIPPLVERTALGRLGQAEDIGKVIATLLSDDCGWITAENIEVSGGFNL
jgi:NAD(P)-dependent dehydrogenase (short-subunit alcohol dehydrogenase family)